MDSEPARSQLNEQPGALSPGLTFERRFSQDGVHPYDLVAWEIRDASIHDQHGDPVFEQKEVEFPAFWSPRATSVVASKYFRGVPGAPSREQSLRQVLDRVVDAIEGWGRESGYFATDADAEVFGSELCHILLHQMAAFNSPVWFNVGIEERPQCSACFINSVEDNLASILDLAKTEGMLFKFGSGTGSNFSTLRSSRENLEGGGTSSGPVSFMRGFDAFAGVIKSGGKTRRAAKMVMLDIGHPDITEFIECKAREEKKAWALIDAGYDGGFDVPGGAYDSIAFQNANHSVRLSDEFMQTVEADGQWTTHAVVDGAPMETYRARDLMRKIAEATWVCGDPGVQFDSTINRWNTCSNTGPIRSSNPCSEFMFLDDTSCNLASINLLAFYDPESERFDVGGFTHACEILITAQEILVDRAGYPRSTIADNSRQFRPLGLGFANLGALLMARGLPYDSTSGRNYAAALSALMSGAAYAQSGRMAAAKGAFPGFEHNRRPMLRVLKMHREALQKVDPAHVPLDILQRAKESWDTVVELGSEHGLRNSQISVIAPTGTISFMMDCDTTGIEPDIALVKYKRLVGGGMIRMVNRSVPLALKRLGYGSNEAERIVAFIDEHDTIEGAPDLRSEHLPVFDCAFKPTAGKRSIHYRGHLEMLAAVQPFVSGAISKTINIPEEATSDEIEAAYLEGWKLGLKAIAIYRNGCKRSQPLSPQAAGSQAPTKPMRRKLPDERHAITHKFVVGGHKGYLTVGLYEDGTPGEIFVVMAKEGSTISGLMDAFATSISLALQHHVPLETLIAKFAHTRFEPSGFTNNPEIPMAKSISDYIFRWLGSKFLSRQEQRELGIVLRDRTGAVEQGKGEQIDIERFEAAAATFQLQTDAPSCQDCGSIMVRNGTCYHCLNCGGTSGCG